MFKILQKMILSLMLMCAVTLTPVHAVNDHNLTDAQLQAFLGIITNFILEDSSNLLDAPTLVNTLPSHTTDSNVTIQIHAEVNSTVFLNSTEVGTVDTNGTVSITILLTHGINNLSVTVKDAQGNESSALLLTIVANIAPIANDINVTVDANSNNNTIALTGTDVDGDDLNYTIVIQPQHGNVTIEGSVAKYAPNANYFDTDSFSFIVNDGFTDSQPAMVDITIAPILKLLINEISSAYYTNDDRWFEIYNPTTQDIDISGYKLKSRAYSGTGTILNSFEFSFPSKIIPAGKYLIIIPNYGPAYNKTLADIENDQVIYLKDTASDKYPLWFSDTKGFLEVLKDGNTIDFVSIGADYVPTTASGWIGTYVPSFTSSPSEFWKSIARDVNSTDSNARSDWQVREFPTYAGLNDVTCNDDADADGIPDCSEVNGSTYAGMDLYAFGARTNQKDIFIEVDYMDSTNAGALPEDKGVVPQKAALEKVKTSFATNGYSVHFDVGNLFSQNGSATNPAEMDLGGGNQLVYSSLAANLENNYKSKVDNMEPRRKQIFYYMLFAISQEANGSAGSSGLAEKPGNDSLMTLGGWGLNTDTVADTNRLINFQAGTVMHEFGHNLNLGHGGNEDKNYKPNYLSVMNYLYQLDGLSSIGDNEGDRYYNNKGAGCPNTPLTNPSDGDTLSFMIDYSHGIASNLEEVTGIDEANGLGHPGSVPVDYNCNGSAADTLTNFNVNPDESTTKDTLTDHNDWNAINIIFARTNSGASGISLDTTSNRKISINPLRNDVQSIAKEVPIRIPRKNP